MSIARFKPVAGMNVADVWRNYLFSDKTATAGYNFAISKAEILAEIPKLTKIVVFAVLHTARHDRHWTQRV